MATPAVTDFPSLTVSSQGLLARGSFAESQARFLDPDAEQIARLRRLLDEKRAGIVAHFYMDVELQAVLHACEHPNIHISDSLVMADAAVEMAKRGVETIVVLGVDFMSENVRAMLDASGFENVAVYRVAEDEIGCSLAASAEALAYGAYLTTASKTPKSLHVVYINTSLRTKARAQHLVPTITCTSSNVVQTILQAAAQEPEVSIWFGPDTYMGRNLEVMFETMTKMSGEEVAAIHPAHSPESIAALLTRYHYFKQGNCVVHHMFGADVVERVRAQHADAHITAHLEVPGEMFSLALEARAEGRGVVGSTSDILGYIGRKVDAAVGAGEGGTLSFVLGTEAGMVSSIVRSLRQRLQAAGDSAPAVEIIFPVASEAVAIDTSDAEMPLIPGVAGGEGCSVAGGCATCPYMKMNTLDATFDVLERSADRQGLVAYEPEKYEEQIDGQSVAKLGGVPILHMRGFQLAKVLPGELIEDMRTRVA